MSCSVENRHTRCRVSEQDLRRVADLTLAAVGRRGAHVNILLVTDRVIRTFNRKFHGQDQATDCLAFGYKRSDTLGDIVISLDRARVYARKWKGPFRHEVWRYCVHSILHLVGYRDDTPTRRKRMWVRQETILKRAIGIIKKNG